MLDRPIAGVIRFGVFEVDLRSGHLRKRGVRVPLQEQPFRILARLLEHPGELVTREVLRQDLWPADTFVDFEHGLNAAVKRLRDALGDSAESPRLVETLPRRGYRFIAPVDGVVRQAEDGVLRRQALRRGLLAAAGVLLLAALSAWAAGWLPSRDARHGRATGEFPYPRTAVAVLPLENRSTDPAFAYLAGGLHDELLTQLSKVSAISTRGRASVREYAGTSKSTRQIAEELRVGALVTASVQVVRDRLRINVELVDAATGQPLWTERYDRSLDDVFAVQSDIAQQIVSAIGAALGPDHRRALAEAPTANAEAYRLYLQGLDSSQRGGWERQDLESAQLFYEHATALDPTFALAHAALAGVHRHMRWFRHDRSSDRLTWQRQAAEAAVRLAPDLPQARVAVAQLYTAGRPGQRQLTAAHAELDAATRSAPNDARLAFLLAGSHRRLGNWDQAHEACARALQLNPRGVDVMIDCGFTHLMTRDYSQAEQLFDQALELAADARLAGVLKGWTSLRWHGRMDTFLTSLERLPDNADLAGAGSGAAQRASLMLLQRNADGLGDLVRSRPENAFDALWFYLPTSLYEAWAHQLGGDRARARLGFGSARALLDSAIRATPDDWRFHAARGLAFAGLGDKAEAVRDARWLAESVEYREDALFGPAVREFRAMILAQAGETEAALAEVERLLATPSFVSVHTLRLDPRWDPLRAHPRFHALLVQDASPGRS
jgi:TolB-like protein/DNA-binding winged helix-turn-helix (wHTH) protein/Flp pilus assembly protein TadD